MKVREFQFPSNGKVYPKILIGLTLSVLTVDVSIPFKRESVSKDQEVKVTIVKIEESFNSLQTGKCIQSRL